MLTSISRIALRSASGHAHGALPKPRTAGRVPVLGSCYTTSQPLSAPTKADQGKQDLHDRNAINTESREYSKSGGDASSAAQEEAAFTPGLNDPEAQKDKAGEGVSTDVGGALSEEG